MNLMTMLVRLQNAMGRMDLAKQMVLLPGRSDRPSSLPSTTNLVVGYDSSPRSQTALDLTLWIAHQTRLATAESLTVQVVYVIDPNPKSQKTPASAAELIKVNGAAKAARRAAVGASAGAAIASTKGSPLPFLTHPELPVGQAEQFEHADRILWQARCMADEWRGSLKTHLRFGSVAQELRQVVESEGATLLVMGCPNREHPMIKALGKNFPCPVLGVPHSLLHPEMEGR